MLFIYEREDPNFFLLDVDELVDSIDCLLFNTILASSFEIRIGNQKQDFFT